MKTKVIICILAATATISCTDYFETETSSIIDEKEYMKQEDEMYKGFLGILNRVQDAGDHAIFLTDTRAALLETTENAPVDLQAIYNYEGTDGNEYADPTCYYAIVAACNDYFQQMEEYKKNVGGMTEIGEENFPALVSSAIRLKAWAYLMLGSIYGEAYWIDQAAETATGQQEASEHCDMKGIASKAIELLESGLDIAGTHCPSTLNVAWEKWLDPESQDATKYKKWLFVVPPSLVLNAEFRSWRASYADETEAQADWQWIRDRVLGYMTAYHTAQSRDPLGQPTCVWAHASSNEACIFQLSKLMQNDAGAAYYRQFFTEDYGDMQALQNISAILYDYNNEQTNRLVQYLCPQYPDQNSFYLRPSDYGMSLYSENDVRGHGQQQIINTLGGQRCVTKYYYAYDTQLRAYKYLNNKELFRIEPAIPTFRGTDLHFLLAEAETHLGHFDVAETLLNNGFNNKFPDIVYPEDSTGYWHPGYALWIVAGNSGYGNLGIAGAANGLRHKLPISTDEDFDSYSETELKEMYDWAIADEHLKEYIAEGKSYSFLCKVAERTARNGNTNKARNLFARRIAPKYRAAGKEQTITTRIVNNGYWIKWGMDD